MVVVCGCRSPLSASAVPDTTVLRPGVSGSQGFVLLGRAGKLAGENGIAAWQNGNCGLVAACVRAAAVAGAAAAGRTARASAPATDAASPASAGLWRRPLTARPPGVGSGESLCVAFPRSAG